HALLGVQRLERPAIGGEGGEVLAIDVLLTCPLLERRLELLLVQHQQADEDLVANRLRTLREALQPGVEGAPALRRDGVDPSADVTVALVETPLDQSAPPQVFQRLIDLTEV